MGIIGKGKEKTLTICVGDLNTTDYTVGHRCAPTNLKFKLIYFKFWVKESSWPV